MDLIKALSEKQLKEVPQILVGDTVRVHVKVKEGARERVQVFEGTVIAKKHGSSRTTGGIIFRREKMKKSLAISGILWYSIMA